MSPARPPRYAFACSAAATRLTTLTDALARRRLDALHLVSPARHPHRYAFPRSATNPPLAPLTNTLARRRLLGTGGDTREDDEESKHEHGGRAGATGSLTRRCGLDAPSLGRLNQNGLGQNGYGILRQMFEAPPLTQSRPERDPINAGKSADPEKRRRVGVN